MMVLLLSIVFFFVLFSQCQAAYTISNKLCITECSERWEAEYGEIFRPYCYYSFKHVEPCRPSGSIVTYFIDSKGTKCNGRCGKFGYFSSSDWCFTEDLSGWDYCTSTESDADEVSYFSPRINYNLSRIAREMFNQLYLPNEKNVFCHLSNRKKRQDDNCTVSLTARNDRGAPEENVVERVAEVLREDFIHFNTFYPNPDPAHPVDWYTTFEAPANANHPDPIVLTVAMRATIRPAHVAQGRQRIRPEVQQHLAEMDWYRGGTQIENDERGHLLADSLGGSGDVYNFVPQSPFTNRAAAPAGSLVEAFCWFDLEAQIRSYLRLSVDNYVRWTITVAYGHLPASRRPTGFMLSVRMFNYEHFLIQAAEYMIPNIPAYACRSFNDPWWSP